LQIRLGELCLGLYAAQRVIPKGGHHAALLPAHGGWINIKNPRQSDRPGFIPGEGNTSRAGAAGAPIFAWIMRATRAQGDMTGV
jgi:hypothetical protein